MRIGVYFQASKSNGDEIRCEIVLSLTALIWLAGFFV
jgi:hypothetical protein